MANLGQYPVESHLTPVQAHTFSNSNGWWRAIVRSEDQYGNEKIRFYLWHDSDGKDWEIKHKWNIQSDRWKDQKSVVEKWVGKPPSSSNKHFPVQHYPVLDGETISKNDSWWTAVVQFEKEWSSTHKTRLYMWDMSGAKAKGTGFKWNIKRDTWKQESMIADAFLKE